MKTAKKKSFSSGFFPTPKFLKMHAVGIDISDASIKFVELVNTRFGKVPGRFGEHKIEKGIVSGGEVQDMGRLAEALISLKENFGLDFIRASLPEEKAYIFRTHIQDSIKEDQIRNILEFKLEEHVPISPQEAVFDYDVVGWHKNRVDANGHIEVAVSVYPKNTIAKYTEVFRRAGLVPLSFEIEAQAIARAVIPKDDVCTCIIVDFGKTRTGLAIVNKGTLSFTSTLEVEGQALTDAVVKYRSVSPLIAKRIKNEEGLMGNKENKELLVSMMGVVELLKEEIHKHYRYWHTRRDEDGKLVDKIEKIILCGGDANLKGLPEYLSNALKIKVERGNVWTNAFSFKDVIPDIDYNSSLSYAPAIGLALRDTS